MNIAPPEWLISDLIALRPLHTALSPGRIGAESKDGESWLEKYQLSLLVFDCHCILFDAYADKLLKAANEGNFVSLVVLRCVYTDRNTWVRGKQRRAEIGEVLRTAGMDADDPWDFEEGVVSDTPDTATLLSWILRFIESTSQARGSKSMVSPPRNLTHPNLERATLIRQLQSSSSQPIKVTYESNHDLTRLAQLIATGDRKLLRQFSSDDLHLYDILAARLNLWPRLALSPLFAKRQSQIVWSVKQALGNTRE